MTLLQELASPPDDERIQIAYCIDRGYLKLTLVSLYSVLKNTRSKVLVHFMAVGLTTKDWDRVEKVIGLFAHAELKRHLLDDLGLQNIELESLYITSATFGRLFIPRLVSGRVIYLDGDTLINDDIAELYHVDLKGNPVGGIRDFCITDDLYKVQHIERTYGKGAVRASRERQNLDRLVQLFGGQTQHLNDYINAGVLVIDTQALRDDPALLQRFEDVASACRCQMLDQDWINIILRGRVTHLDPAWNSFKGNGDTNKSIYPADLRRAYRRSRKKPALVHFVSKRKPWKRFRLSYFRRGFSWHVKYRLVQHEMFRRIQ